MARLKENTFDMVLTDPPYITNYRDRDGRTIKGDTSSEWLKPSMMEISRVLKPTGVLVSFYGWNQVEKFMIAWKSAGLRPIGHLVFCKDYPSKVGILKSQHECAYVLSASPDQVSCDEPISDVRYWKYSGNQYHPTQKPVGILKRLIEAFTKPGDLILDPFMGSGSTLVAAKYTNRRSIGIEIDKRYYQVAKDRLQQNTALSARTQKEPRWKNATAQTSILA